MANFVDKVKKAESTVKKAKASHVTAVSNAEKVLKQAESTYLANIKRIEKQIDEVEKEYSQKVDSFGGITLYRDHIKGNGKAFKLDSSVVAKVDIDGSIYASRAADGGKEISRIAHTRQEDGIFAPDRDPAASMQSPNTTKGAAAQPAGTDQSQASRQGVDEAAAQAPASQQGAAGIAKPSALKASSKPKGAHVRVDEEDSSQPADILYVTIESDYGRIGVQVKPDKLGDARNFALQVSAVSAAAEAGEKEKEAKLASLRSQLAQAKQQTADIDQAKEFLNSVEADNSTVVAAEKNLTGLMGGASRKDLVALSEHQLKLKKRKKTLIIAAAVIVLIAIIGVAVVLNLPK